MHNACTSHAQRMRMVVTRPAYREIRARAAPADRLTTLGARCKQATSLTQQAGAPHEPAAFECPDARRRGVAASLHQRGGAARDRADDHRSRRGHPDLRQRREALHRGDVGALVRGARLRQCRADRGGAAADGEAALLPSLHRQEPRAGGGARREDQGPGARAHGAGLLPVERLGGERHPGEARLVLQQRAGPAGEEEDPEPDQGLSRRHHRRGVADRARQQPSRLRPAGARDPASRDAALLEGRRGRRERGGLHRAARGRTRGHHRGRGAGDDRGLHRRAGDGRGRGDPAAGRLFRGDGRHLPEARHPDDLRRGDHRIRAHRRVVRGADAGLSGHLALDGQAADRRLLSAQRGGDQRPHGRGDRGQFRADRHLRARLHLRRASGRLRGRGQGARDLRADRRLRAGARGWRRASPRISTGWRSIRWWARRGTWG